MKLSLFSFLMVGLCLLPVLPAAARETTVLKATILELHSNLIAPYANDGQVSIDLGQNEMNIDLYDDPCGLNVPKKGQASCRIAPRKVASYSVRLDSVKDAPCDVVVYQGSVDNRKTDGSLIEVEISDNKLFGQHCHSIVAVPETSGRMTFTSAHGNKHLLTFVATPLLAK